MKIRIADFKGEIPRRSDRLLPDNVATVSSNARLNDGKVSAFRESALVEELAGAAVTIYRHGNEWISFDQIANVEPGPVAQDRLYYTIVNSSPKMIVDDTTYELALPSPAAAPTLALDGTLDPDLAETILYTYTFVTEFDEESAPAPISAPLEWSPGLDVDLSAMSAAPAGRAIDRRRIYRSQTSASGITDLYFVAEIPIADTTYTHDLEAAPLQEVLPSANYDQPLATLDGLVAMSNGMMAAFSGREVFFCEPYRPHAWPRQYALIVDFDIVALAAFGTTLAILTKGTPYIVQGTAPENMVMERMEANFPCVSRRGVVDLGYSAAYPSNDGLIVISQAGVQMASRNLFTRDDWRALAPATFFAASYDGRYAFGYRDGDIDILDGGAPDLNPSEYDEYDAGLFSAGINGFTVYDGGNSLTRSAINAIGFIDLTGEQPHFLRTDPELTGSPETMFMDPESSNLFLLINNDTITQYDARTRPPTSYTWRSKAFYFASPVSFAGVLVESDTSEAESTLATRVYADGELVREITRFNRAERLPAGFRAKEWQIEIIGSAEVTMISMAETLEELAVP